jgi:hypothetical protein
MSTKALQNRLLINWIEMLYPNVYFTDWIDKFIGLFGENKQWRADGMIRPKST